MPSYIAGFNKIITLQGYSLNLLNAKRGKLLKLLFVITEKQQRICGVLKISPSHVNFSFPHND